MTLTKLGPSDKWTSVWWWWCPSDSICLFVSGVYPFSIMQWKGFKAKEILVKCLGFNLARLSLPVLSLMSTPFVILAASFILASSIWRPGSCCLQGPFPFLAIRGQWYQTPERETLGVGSEVILRLGLSETRKWTETTNHKKTKLELPRPGPRGPYDVSLRPGCRTLRSSFSLLPGGQALRLCRLCSRDRRRNWWNVWPSYQWPINTLEKMLDLLTH